jgi:hypothetical protein
MILLQVQVLCAQRPVVQVQLTAMLHHTSWAVPLVQQAPYWIGCVLCGVHRVCLQAVLRSSGNQVWEKGDNHKAKLVGSQDVSLYHEFRA